MYTGGISVIKNEHVFIVYKDYVVEFGPSVITLHAQLVSFGFRCIWPSADLIHWAWVNGASQFWGLLFGIYFEAAVLAPSVDNEFRRFGDMR